MRSPFAWKDRYRYGIVIAAWVLLSGFGVSISEYGFIEMAVSLLLFFGLTAGIISLLGAGLAPWMERLDDLILPDNNNGGS